MVFIIVVLFLLSRLVNLMGFPIFLDETIYVRWLETIKNTHQWLLPLREFGWAPLTTWLATLISYLVKDNLLSLRLIAALFGGLSLIVAYKLAKSLFSQSVTTIFTLIFILFSPLVLIHDRLGLRGDSAVTFSALLLLYGLDQRLLKKKSSAALLIGLAVALGLLIKSTAWILPIIVVLAYLVFRPRLRRFDWLGSLLASTSLLFYLGTGSLAAFLNKTSVFLVSFSQTASLAKNNLIQIFHWSYQYLSVPVLLLILYGAYQTFKKQRQVWLLLSLSIVPVLLFDILFAKILFPRYLLFVAVFSLLFAAVALASIWEKLPRLLQPLLLIVVFTPNFITDLAVIRDMKKAPLPEIERWQYVTGWPSGYALPDLVKFLKQNPPDVFITEANDLIRSGLPYLWPDHSMKIISLDDNLRLIDRFELDQVTYLALNVSENLPPQFIGELIAQFPRPENKSSIKLFSITGIQ